MTDEQFSDLLDKLATVQMAFSDGCLDDADIHLLQAMDLLKEIEGKPWPEWLKMTGERTPLPKRVAMIEAPPQT